MTTNSMRAPAHLLSMQYGLHFSREDDAYLSVYMSIIIFLQKIELVETFF